MAEQAGAVSSQADSDSLCSISKISSIDEIILLHKKGAKRLENTSPFSVASSEPKPLTFLDSVSERVGARKTPSQLANEMKESLKRRRTCSTCSSEIRLISDSSCPKCANFSLATGLSTAIQENPPRASTEYTAAFRDRLTLLDDRNLSPRAELLAYLSHEASHADVIQKQLMRWDSRHARSWKDKFLDKFNRRKNLLQLPEREDLLFLAKHHYPPRASCLAFVYDINESNADFQLVNVGDVERYWKSKPDKAIVRWIHVPFGPGLPHSTIEDMFLHSGRRGYEFSQGGTAGCPYLATDSLQFIHEDRFREMRNAFDLLSKDSSLLDALNQSTWQSNQSRLFEDDITWRANEVSASQDFWSLNHSDMPGQLSEEPWTAEKRLSSGSIQGTGAIEGLHQFRRQYRKQALHSHPFFKNSQLVKNTFRAFHTQDGFILTLSATAGVEYLSKEFEENLRIPRDCLWSSSEATCIGRIIKKFQNSGAQSWHRKTLEWFLIYLISEVGCTPNNRIHGGNAPDLKNAYESVIAELVSFESFETDQCVHPSLSALKKSRRYGQETGQSSAELVRDYLNCIDELNVLAGICRNKIEMFKGLVQDCEDIEAKHNSAGRCPDNPEGVSSLERAQWSLKTAQETLHWFENFIRDATQSLEALYQLRSIEQNERSIQMERLNKAVFVFTAVTIVFLPLSFFSSYYGMNLSGIIGTNKNEAYFWTACGVPALILVIGAMLYSFRVEARDFFSKRRHVDAYPDDRYSRLGSIV